MARECGNMATAVGVRRESKIVSSGPYNISQIIHRSATMTLDIIEVELVYDMPPTRLPSDIYNHLRSHRYP